MLIDTVQVRSKATILLRRALHAAGVDLVRSLDESELLRRRLQLLKGRDISVVFDVGAGSGQYAQTMRALGYGGRLVSFEPLPGPYSLLRSASATDPDWTAVNVALGETAGEAVMHVSRNCQSSSVLDMLAAHEEAEQDSTYIGECRVPMTTLSRMVSEHFEPADRLFIKIDTQGYEDKVIAGLGEDIGRVSGLQLEMSLVPLYRGQVLLPDLVTHLASAGFTLMSIEPGFWDRDSGQLLQADGIFFRS